MPSAQIAKYTFLLFALSLSGTALTAQSLMNFLSDSNRLDLDKYCHGQNGAWGEVPYKERSEMDIWVYLKDNVITGQTLNWRSNNGKESFEIYYENNAIRYFCRNYDTIGANLLDTTMHHRISCQNGIDMQFYDNGLLKCYGNKLCLNPDTILRDTIYRFDSLTLQTDEYINSIDYLSVKTGTWLYYKPDGQLQRREQWDNKGILIKKEEF